MLLSISSGVLSRRFGDLKAIPIYVKAGFDAVDLALVDVPGGQWGKPGQDEYIQELLHVAKENGTFFNQAHAENVYDWDDPNVVDGVVKPTVVNNIRCAAKLGIPHIIVHGLSHPAVNHSTEERRRVNLEFFNYLKPFAKDAGIKIALENLRRVCTTPEEYEYMMDNLNDDIFTACVDVGHSFYVGQDAAEIIRRLGHERVTALHIHDNQGQADDHQMPGFGKIEWNHILEALADIDYSGDFNLEILDFITGLLDSKHGFDDDFALDAMRIAEISGRYLKNKLERMIAARK